jgi:flagellar hook-associated protein 1 FlgK
MSVGALNNALSGLRVAQNSINVISGNVANVQTEGYTRKIAPQSSRAVDGVSAGAFSETIFRKVDTFLQGQYWSQVSDGEFLTTQTRYLERVSAFHGKTDDERSIASEIGRLRDSFAVLSDSPDNTILLRQTLDRAGGTVKKINDLANLYIDLRNEAQGEIENAVNQINQLTEKIATLNKTIQSASNLNRPVGEAEDSRDQAVKELAKLVDISFFRRGDNVLVVQTKQGSELVSERVNPVFFKPTPIDANSTYPDSAAGLYLGGDPNVNQGAQDVASQDLGGKLGALFALRDKTLPTQHAQLDEMVHKMAMRFDAQGLKLFTNSAGNIPANTAPNPTTKTPVPYVGFSNDIQLNSTVVDDPTLLRSGTYGETVQKGSNEVLRRISEFALGDTQFQKIEGSIDLTLPTTDDLQTRLGLFSTNTVTGYRNLQSITSTITSAPASSFNALPATNIFRVTIGNGGTVPNINLDIDLSNARAIGAANYNATGTIANALDQIVDLINEAADTANIIPADNANYSFRASKGINGELRLDSRTNIAISRPTGVATIGEEDLNFIGLKSGSYAATDPYFDIAVGLNTPTRISIESGDTETDLLTKIRAVKGLSTTGVTIGGVTGTLNIRPGTDLNNDGTLDFGGDLKITGGPFTSTGSTNTGVNDGDTILKSLFGASSPIQNVRYGDTGSIGDFRTSNLGASVSLELGVDSNNSIISFTQGILNQQATELNLTKSREEDVTSLGNLLNKRLSDESGVNIDEELSNLIIVQTAYSAAARTMNAIDEMLQELLNTIL